MEARYLVRRADGRMLEISSLLYLIVAAADGDRGVRAIALLVSEQSGHSLSAHDVSYLIEHKLVPLGVVISGPADAPPRPVARTAVRPLLALSARARVLPSRLVRPAAATLHPLFWAPVIVAMMGALAAVDAWLLCVGALGHALHDVLRQPSLLLVVAALVVMAGALHELGHATASLYGGAEPGAIGIGIYLLWPAFSNDLTASYRLNRTGRLRADLGGVYFNGVFSVLMGATYWVTGWTPLVVVIAWQHVAVLQQFLPLVRLDGYYVLSDLVGVPDLFPYLRPALSQLVPGRPTDPAMAGLTPRARRVVTAWALVTLPILLTCVALLALRLPGLLSTGWHSVELHGHTFATAMRDSDAVAGLLNGVEIAVLLVPFAGLLLLVSRALRQACRWCWGRRQTTSAGPGATLIPPPVASGGVTTASSTGTRSGLLLTGAADELVVRRLGTGRWPCRQEPSHCRLWSATMNGIHPGAKALSADHLCCRGTRPAENQRDRLAASAATCTRLVSPSFLYTCDKCDATVRWETYNTAPTSRLVSPSATNSMTANSAGVRLSHAPGGASFAALPVSPNCARSGMIPSASAMTEGRPIVVTVHGRVNDSHGK